MSPNRTWLDWNMYKNRPWFQLAYISAINPYAKCSTRSKSITIPPPVRAALFKKLVLHISCERVQQDTKWCRLVQRQGGYGAIISNTAFWSLGRGALRFAMYSNFSTILLAKRKEGKKKKTTRHTPRGRNRCSVVITHMK